jgi:hypothetical protein
VSEKKVIVCLANSWKHSDRCVAGVEWVDGHRGDWVRPVSARDGHGVSFLERQLSGGGDPAPLDILQISLLAAQPAGYQAENWLLDPASSWSKLGECRWNNLGLLEDTPDDLWGTGGSSGKGVNDRVDAIAAVGLSNSLALVRVNAPVLHVLDGGFQQVKREVRASFRYRGVAYNLKVTDPTYVNNYLVRGDGLYQLGDCYLTVSLTEPFLGFCYKVIAAVIEPGGPGENQ